MYNINSNLTTRARTHVPNILAKELRSKLRLTENPNMASPTEILALRQYALQYFRDTTGDSLVDRLAKVQDLEFVIYSTCQHFKIPTFFT